MGVGVEGGGRGGACAGLGEDVGEAEEEGGVEATEKLV